MGKTPKAGTAGPDVKAMADSRNAPTLPKIATIPGAGDRSALLGGIDFIDGIARGWREENLVRWLDTYFVGPNRMVAPTSVRDPVAGTFALRRPFGATKSVPPPSAKARNDELPKLLSMSRSRVVITLRGFISKPPDDRFLQAAIYSERVRRVAKPRPAWMAQPKPTDLLSDIALSLFVIDILTHREIYEDRMCVCDVCGRVSFSPDETTRTGCNEHMPRLDGKSGFQTKG